MKINIWRWSSVKITGLFLFGGFMFSIESLLNKQAVEMYFQPILSAEEKKITGFEALCRGADEFKGIPVEYIFSEAKKQNYLLELDRLCRYKACENFLCEPFSDKLLFINFNAAIIDKGVLGSMVLYETVIKNGLKPENIVIEIVESKVKDIDSLIHFINFYRGLGFNIALDDIGAAYSNLERISLLKPDIIKIDRSLINNIHNEHHKKEILTSLVNLGKGIGALIVAEGIENEEEALVCLETGANMLQGYYFQKPLPIKEIKSEKLHFDIQKLAEKHKKISIERKQNENNKKCSNKLLIQKIINELSKTSQYLDISFIKGSIQKESLIECIYLLDKYGMQASDTLFIFDLPKKRKSPLFKPGLLNTNHSAKDYFYQLDFLGENYYETRPYLSKASGNLCTTLSSSFKKKNDEFIYYFA
jgi:EAL domain-containing protein (putative c-di-GMP-specific phosphodiesterase class I)